MVMTRRKVAARRKLVVDESDEFTVMEKTVEEPTVVEKTVEETTVVEKNVEEKMVENTVEETAVEGNVDEREVDKVVDGILEEYAVTSDVDNEIEVREREEYAVFKRGLVGNVSESEKGEGDGGDGSEFLNEEGDDGGDEEGDSENEEGDGSESRNEEGIDSENVEGGQLIDQEMQANDELQQHVDEEGDSENEEGDGSESPNEEGIDSENVEVGQPIDQEMQANDELQQHVDGGVNELQQDINEDVVPPVILKYRLETIMDECGNMPGRVTFRDKLGVVLGLIKSKVKKDNKLGEMIVAAGLSHYLELEDKKWLSACGNLLHFFLLREIKCKKLHELWFLIGNKPIRFGLREFCLVTGLRCSLYPPEIIAKKVHIAGKGFVEKVKKFVLEKRKKKEEKEEKEQKRKEKEMKGKKRIEKEMEKEEGKGKRKGRRKETEKDEGKKKRKVTEEDEEEETDKKKEKSKRKVKRKENFIYGDELWEIIRVGAKAGFTLLEKSQCALMYLVHTVVLGEQETNSIREEYLAWTASPEFFYSYPWGRVSYLKLLKNLKRDLRGKAKERNRKIAEGEPAKPATYTIAGFWNAFYVWAYEAVDGFGDLLGGRSFVSPYAIPRFLRWHRTEHEESVLLVDLEKKIKKNQVNCIPMFQPSEEELESEYYADFVEMDDNEDEVIDSLKLQLADVSVLRFCDGVEAPGIDEVPEVREPVDDPCPPQHDDPSHVQHIDPSPSQHTIPSTSTGGSEEMKQKMENLEKELREVKKLCVGMAKDLQYLRKMNGIRKMSMSTSNGKRKRKEERAKPEAVAKKLKFCKRV